MSGASSGAPPGAGNPVRKKGAVALQVKLACATLEAVKTRYPELRERRFVLRTRQPYPVDTMVRLETRLNGGGACFLAAAAVEKVVSAGSDPAAMTLAIVAMDEPGRNLVASMGGKPPRPMKEGADTVAIPAATGGAAIPDLGAEIASATAATLPAVESSEGPEAGAAQDDGGGIDWDAAAPAYPVPEDKAPAPSAAKGIGDDLFDGDFGEAEALGAAASAAPASTPPPAATKPPPKPAFPPKSAVPDKPAPKAAAPTRAAPPASPAAKPPAAPAAATAPPAPSKPAPSSPPPASSKSSPSAPPPPVAAKKLPAAPAIPAQVKGAGAPAQAFSSVPPPMPPPSRRPTPPPLPPPTMAKGAGPGGAEPTLVEDVVPEPAAESKKGRIIGIDLGTTNSAAAVVKEGKPFIIPSREGYNTIPSVVALNEKGNMIVGHPARGQLLINPRTTVYGFKRLVGRQFNSPVVADLVGRFSYEIAPGLRGEASVKLADKIYSLQKISSLVLTEVKELAERWLNEPVARAVITVPAYYNDNQRQAVRAAGALAGLEVERIVNEPTAAAIAFAHGRTMEQRVMVYDLGGGTFDTSVLQLQGSVYEVLSTGGDTFLGGVDFDKELVNDLLARFKKRHGVDFSGDRVAYQRINDAAERAKISLSERLTTQVKVPFVCMVGDKPYDVDETVTRAELEKLTSDLVDRTLRVCDDVLINCGLKPSDIGEVLLVGGQSRMPLVRNKIRAFFGKEPSKAVHPDEAVALGAALLADSIQSGEIGGMVLMDVLPMSIGVGLPGGRFKKVVERNTALPHRKVHSVWTSQDQQRMLEIPIFQGESAKAQDNEYLGTLVVADIPPGTKGNVVFDVIFDVSPESILKVTAEERGTARSVTATFSTQDTPDAVRRKLAGPNAAQSEPEPLEEGASRKSGLFGWLKKRRAE